MNPLARSDDPVLLHPVMRRAVAELLGRLQAEGLPFRLFEGWRSPERQADLFAQGRSRPGAIVTRAQPWDSFHQYGLAVDIVLREHEHWSWDTAGHRRGWWRRLHDVGRAHGLDPLEWEMPHLQLACVSLAELRAGRWPAGGDRSWADNLAAAIRRWPHRPKPPLPTLASIQEPAP